MIAKIVKGLRLSIGLPVFVVGWSIFGVGAIMSVIGFKIAGFEEL